MTPLLDALKLPNGIVCAVGAGGKKSLMYAIADEFPGRLACTTTVHSTRPPRRTGIEVQTAPVGDLLAHAAGNRRSRRMGFYQTGVKRGRVAGMAPDDVEKLHIAGAFDLTLVKADGARMRGIKAPRPGEPVLPTSTKLVLVVVSAGVLGLPLDEDTAHRPERISLLTGLTLGGTIGPEHLGRLFAAPDGALQGTSDVPVRIVLNQVDNAGRQRLARQAAEAILAQTPRVDAILLTQLAPSVPVHERLVAQVRRSESEWSKQDRGS